MKKTLLITLLILFINNILIAQEVSVFEVSGSYTWEVPEGVNSIKVYAWGGGGGGGAAIYENTRGGGGAGGSITVSTVSVQPGEVLQIIVGNRGVGGFSDGGNGGNTTISGSFGTILAYGGAGGKRGYRNSCQVVVGSYCCSSSSWGGCRSYCSIYNTVPCGGVQYGSAGIATVGLTFNGGSGGNGSAGISGAGGGSAGDMGSGGNANFGTAGIAGLGNYSGAKGADGRSTAGSGIPSSEVGGGGSGGFVGQQGFTSYAGGSGGPGKLVIEFIKDCTAPEFIKVPDSTNEETLPAAQCEKQIFYDIQVEEETNLFFEFSGATELTGSGSGSGELFKAGITNVFIKAINSCDEESTFNFEINLKDKTSPVITTNQDQNLTTEAGLCTASFEATATASDNCSVGAPTGVRSDDKPLTDPYPVGTTTITWTVSDANGNPAVPVVQTIKVTDNQAPVIITNQDQNLTTEAGLCTASFEATATATDNCSVGAPTGIRSDNKPLADSYPVGTTMITWTVNDANGNPAVPVVQTITVTDNQAPVITTNQNQNLTTEAGICTASFEASATATDNCSVGVPTGVRSDDKPLTDPYPVGTTTIAWTVSDANGNPAVPVVQTIKVTDNQAPVIITNQDQNLTTEAGLCTASFEATATATDNCSVGAPTGIRSDNKPLADSYPVGTTTITWTVNDANGNPAVPVVQTITVTDNQAPVITTNQNQNLTTEAGLCTASFEATASATDNCSVGAPTGIRSDNKPLTDSYPVGVTTITWTVSDINGNPATPVVQTITVTDNQAPVITTNQDQNLTTEAGLCTASFEATATASDNCSVGAPTGIRSDNKPLTDPYPVGTTTITWTVSDANGNPAVPVVQTIKVTDNQAPAIITNQDQNLTTEAGICTASFEATATASDNCSVGAPTGIRSDNKPLTDSYPVGVTTITWTVSDINGNPAVPVVQTITVTDNQAPVITTNQNQNLTTEAGLCTASFEATASATDNCSVGAPTGIRSDNKPLTDSYPVGVTTITWTVSDINGNPATPVVQTITVTDSQAPSWETALGELDRTVFCGQDQLLSSAQNLQPFGFDNCTIKSIQKTSGNFVSTGLNGAGTFTNTWIAEDLAGNKSTVFNQVITIQGLEVDASASGTPVPLNSTATLSAKVIPAVEGISVNFYLDEEFKGSKATDEFGIATLDVTGLPLNVYKVTAVVGSGCAESIAYLPVYDPNGNFVTGGGWINSPEGALIGTTTVGKANFGFVSKYKKGSNQVDGNTEFQFNAGNLSFKSILHEAGTLVISGKKATYRGEGSINGVSGFKFTLVAIDGQWNGGTNPDQFRIKIWGSNGVIYDNGLGADENSEVSTVLGGGSIVIHESKTKGNKRVSAELITVPWNTPFETIRKKVDQMSSTWFESRKLLMTLDAGTYDPLTPGLYELKANLIDNEFFELDEPIAIQVLVQDKPKALDIKLSNQKVVKNAGSGTVIGSLNTIDPVDDIHTYSMDPNPDLEIRGNQLIWKGTNTPAAQMTITVFSTDRAGQTISKDIVLTREVGPNQFILYPNPAQNETNIMVDLDEGAEVEIQVFDAVGRMVIEDTIYRESTFIQTLDLNGMAPGMYMVQVKIGYIIMTERLIKR